MAVLAALVWLQQRSNLPGSRGDALRHPVCFLAFCYPFAGFVALRSRLAFARLSAPLLESLRRLVPSPRPACPFFL